MLIYFYKIQQLLNILYDIIKPFKERFLHNLELIYSIASSKQLLIRAIKIAIVVGIILNTINQGDLIFAFDIENISFIKMALTFCVPFCVSMYTAIAMKMKFHVGEKVIEDVSLSCKGCNGCISLKKEQIIPFCKKCNEKTQWKLILDKENKCQQHK